jgi:hypothetical protein|tara:strand:+ start:5049 stop:5585 length:537 start_codon:yes stop_codon:yes gene_type:complete
MEWDKKQDVTFDYSVHSHGDDRTTAVLTTLVELANLISNHLGSNIDPNTKPTTPSQKKGQKVDVVRLTAKPIGVEQNISKGFVKTRKNTRDFTGSSISKEEEKQEELNAEKLLPQLGAIAVGAMSGGNDNEKKAMNPMSTSEGKALLNALQETANKLRKFLMTSRVDAEQAQQPTDMK